MAKVRPSKKAARPLKKTAAKKALLRKKRYGSRPPESNSFDDESDDESLHVYIQYEKLTVATLSDILFFIEEIKNDAVAELISKGYRFIREPELEIIEAYTGNSINLKIKCFEFETEVKIPTGLGVAVLIASLTLMGFEKYQSFQKSSIDLQIAKQDLLLRKLETEEKKLDIEERLAKRRGDSANALANYIMPNSNITTFSIGSHTLKHTPKKRR
jgi:hypothetical protein